MVKERVLIAVKTYPALSKKYIELACTAGFREDGTWIRIYPIPFRLLSDASQYRKYQWIEIDLMKNSSDPRPESFRPIDVHKLKPGIMVGTKCDWEERRDLILSKNKVYTNIDELIALTRSNSLSLAVFKPKEILDFVVEEPEQIDWSSATLEAAAARLKQRDLFDERDFADFKLVRKLPYKFSYKFIDDSGKDRTLMIEDWEIGQLYWNCAEKYGDKIAVQKVREKYLDDFARTKDLHLFLGTTRRYHTWAKNPFVIVGTFHPTFTKQPTLRF